VMLRGLRDKATNKVSTSITKADHLGLRDDFLLKNAKPCFGDAGAELRDLGNLWRDSLSVNHFKFAGQLVRNEKRQAELQPFLDPDEGHPFTARDSKTRTP
jgi:hypothetical protein